MENVTRSHRIPTNDLCEGSPPLLLFSVFITSYVLDLQTTVLFSDVSIVPQESFETIYTYVYIGRDV